MRTFLGGRFSSVRKRLFDNFTRANQTGLGIATDGTTWDVVSGTVSISSNKAVATAGNGSAASSYSISTTTMPLTDATIELKDTTNGSAAALWVQNSTDWWLVSQEASSYTYSYYYYAGTTYAGTTYTGTGSWTTGPFYYSYLVFNNWYTTPQYYNTFTYNTYGPYYTAYYALTYASGTNYYLKVLQSVAGVVSSITNLFIASDTIIRSFRVKTTGNTITAQGYSDNNLTNQLGSTQSYTATSPTKTPKYGVSFNTSSTAQGTSIASSVNITENL